MTERIRSVASQILVVVQVVAGSSPVTNLRAGTGDQRDLGGFV
jgi:hypothetical protein